MVVSSSRVNPFEFLAIVVLVFVIAFPCLHAQSLAPAPAPTSDGTSIDQGIAYVLMLLALVLTYLIQTTDASYSI